MLFTGYVLARKITENVQTVEEKESDYTIEENSIRLLVDCRRSKVVAFFIGTVARMKNLPRL